MQRLVQAPVPIPSDVLAQSIESNFDIWKAGAKKFKKDLIQSAVKRQACKKNTVKITTNIQPRS